MTALTETETSERDRLAAVPASYFRAVDSLDVEAVLEHFATDATLTVQTAQFNRNGKGRFYIQRIIG